MVYSAAVTDGFIRDTEEVNARISPTRFAIEQLAEKGTVWVQVSN